MRPSFSNLSPENGSLVFLGLARMVDEGLRNQTAGEWRCRHALPRIDGTAYFLLERGGREIRIDWIHPENWDPSSAFSTGRFKLDSSARELPADMAERMLGLVSGVASECLGHPTGRLLRWQNPARRSGGLAEALSGLFTAGKAVWGEYSYAGLEKTGDAAVSLSFQGPAGRLRFSLHPAEASAGQGQESILDRPDLFLRLEEDPRSAAERRILAHQLERFLGFILYRAFPPSAGGPVEAEVQEPDEYYLYLNMSICNANCMFCSRGTPQWKERIEREIKDFDYQAELAAIERSIGKRQKKKVFHVGGHEPSIYPTILPILRAADREGYSQIILETNGLALADGGFVEELKSAGVTQVKLPIYGTSAEVHDPITGVPGSLDLLLQAISNLKKNGIQVIMKTVLLKQNLHEIVPIFSAYPGAGCSLVMPNSPDPADYRRVCPALGSLSSTILDLVGDTYLPCIFPRRRRKVCSSSAIGVGFVVLDGGKVIFQGEGQHMSQEQRLQQKVKLDKCRSCKQLERCTGIYAMYFEVYGEDEIKPI